MAVRDNIKQSVNYRPLGDTVECRACAHFCRISKGQSGICGLRQNIGGKLYLLSYGHPAAVNIDPIEKKPLFHFLPGSLVYSFGTLGCNFRCANCQNHSLSQMFGQEEGRKENKAIPWGIDLSPAEIVENALESQCASIAYTYNEPTIFLEYALDTMRLAKSKGLKNIWVSNGFMSEETLDLISPYLDAINIDIKSFDEEFYRTYCGGRLEPVLENCRRLIKNKVWLEITTLIIPTLSDGKEMLRKIARFIRQELGEFVPWHVSAFSGEISWKLKHLPDTPLSTIKTAYDIGREEGLKHVYTGNIWREGIEDTFCHSCGQPVIKRVGYDVKRLDKDGYCSNCRKEIVGVFEHKIKKGNEKKT